MWTLVDVEAYCGVRVRCEIVEVRRLGSCAAYTVKPKENKEDEMRKAGVPRGDWSSTFTAFDWQVRAVQPDLKAEKEDASRGAPRAKVIRKPCNAERYVST